MNTAHYLQVFERFDAAGRRQLRWHPAAGVFTLGWLVFRRLWVEALIYVLLCVAVVGLCLWVWPVLQHWPAGVRWGVLGTVMLLALWLPGLLGHGLLHRQVQRRLLRAVSAARSMNEAHATLAKQAATRRRLWGVVTVHVVVVLAVLGLMWFWPGGQPVVVLAVSPALTPATASPEPSLIDSQTPVNQVVQPQVDVVTVAPVAKPEPEQAPSPAPAAEPPSAPSSAAPDSPVPESPTPPVPMRLAEAAQSPTPVEQGATYLINVGLFADEGNAQRAQQSLLQAGLPVRVDRISTRKGPRTRVRVGPYPQREAADEAAQRIRALGLEAVVFRP